MQIKFAFALGLFVSLPRAGRTFLYSFLLGAGERRQSAYRRVSAGEYRRYDPAVRFSLPAYRGCGDDPARRSFSAGRYGPVLHPVRGGVDGILRSLLDNFWAIVISGGVSTMLVLVCVGRVFQKLNKKA